MAGAVVALPHLLSMRLALLPTPTITPTLGPRATATPDFLATRNAQEVATQEAFRLALVAQQSATPTPGASPTPDGEEGGPPTPTVSISLPVVESGGRDDQTTDPQPAETEAPPATVQISLPVISSSDPATSTPTPEPAIDSPLPTATPTYTPLPTVTPTFTPESAVQTVRLQGVMRESRPIRAGPSSLYTQTATLNAGQVVIMEGRESVGEWVYLCCEQDVAGWTLQANVQIQGNQWPEGSGNQGDPNNANRLNIRAPQTPLAQPFNQPTPVPGGDFPFWRRDPASQANVGQLPRSNLRRAWPDNEGATGGGVTSPVVVVGLSVVVASADLNLYSLGRDMGNQRLRHPLPSPVRVAPAMVDNIIYAATENGVVLALQDQGGGAVELWSTNLGAVPAAGINAWERFLFVPGANGLLYALNQEGGEIAWSRPIPGPQMQYPAMGRNLLYVGSQNILALDIYNNGEVAWQRNDVGAVTAPPLYSAPGFSALAELYVADASSRIWALDANTGRDLWQRATDGPIYSLTVDNDTLYLVSNNSLQAISRNGSEERWRYSLGERLAGSPIAGPNSLLLVTESGSIRLLDKGSGSPTATFTLMTNAVGAPAVSGDLIFVPGSDGFVYALRGDP
jgi:outer membrane protein assembly factor BamB